MSIEFEEYEEPLSRVGTFLLMLSSMVLFILEMVALGSVDLYTTQTTPWIYRFSFMGIVTAIVFIFGLLSFARNWIRLKINVFIASILSLVLMIFLILSAPGAPFPDTLTLAIQLFIWFSIFSIAAIFIAKRPNLGKESNKHIYQAYGAIIEAIVGICIVFLGFYAIFVDIADFAGNGTFPGGFENTYLEEFDTIEFSYQAIRISGVIIVVSGLIVIIGSLVRNIIGLRLAAATLSAGIITGLVGLSYFVQNWQELDRGFENKYPDEYAAQLALNDPIVFNLGIVLVMLLFIGLFMIIYASSQSEPLEKWKTKRNHFLAAAEVAVRDQKLSKAIGYLEKASVFSSKLGEEDKAVELITRINNIKDKAIKMRKSEAAEKKKAELEEAKKKAMKKAPSAARKAAETKKGE